MKTIQQRVVVDTNVFVSGIFWSGPPCQILKAWIEKQVILIVSLEILEEYKRVIDFLSKKYSPIDQTDFLELITQEAYFCKPVKLLRQISKDPDDDKFIACALAAQACYIISGDSDLLSIEGIEGVKVIAPSNYVNTHLALNVLNIH